MPSAGEFAGIPAAIGAPVTGAGCVGRERGQNGILSLCSAGVFTRYAQPGRDPVDAEQHDVAQRLGFFARGRAQPVQERNLDVVHRFDVGVAQPDHAVRQGA